MPDLIELRDKLIVTLRLSTTQATFAACLLRERLAHYKTLYEVLDCNDDAVKVSAYRLNHSKAFSSRKLAARNAWGLGYYFDPTTRERIFRELDYVDPLKTHDTPAADVDSVAAQ
jgi:hypothetical protein